MCANYKAIRSNQANLFGMAVPVFECKEDIYPGYHCPIIFKSSIGLEWREVLFGMVPKWAKDTKITRNTYNARSESISLKPSFKEAWYKSQFCLIPVNKIYEPRYFDTKAERWAIEREDKQPYTLAGLYEITRIEGQIIRSMTMLTINADNNRFMQQFHKPQDEKRSIVVIPPEYREDWLTACTKTATELLFEFNPSEFKTYAEPR